MEFKIVSPKLKNKIQRKQVAKKIKINKIRMLKKNYNFKRILI